MTDLPCDVQLVVTNKVGMVTAEGVEDERLVRLGDVCVGEAALVGEVHLRGEGACAETGLFGVKLEVDGLGGLDTQHELVS